MTYTEKRLEEFDIAFPKGGTSGWIGDPSYPADLCCGADSCLPNCDEKKREAIKAFLADRTALLTELRDSELLEEDKNIDGSDMKYHFRNGQNSKAKAIKAHINNLINSRV